MRSVLIALAVAALLAAQDAPASRPASDPKAVALFKKALAAQTDGGPPIVIRDFQAELEVTKHDTDPNTHETTPHGATVVQSYKVRPGDEPLFNRHLIDKIQRNETVQGYDGDHWWQQLGKAPPIDLSRDRQNADDKKRIKDEIERTKDYLRFLLLSNLDGPDVTLEYAGPATILAYGKERNAERIIRHHPKERIELFIGDYKGKSVLYGFSRKVPSGKTELISFYFHELIKSEGSTALVPRLAQYFELEGQTPRLTFEAAAQRPQHIKFNVGLDDKFFAMPK